MLTLGLCNVVGSFFHSMPVTGSFSRSAVNNASGVRTPLGGIYTGNHEIFTIIKTNDKIKRKENANFFNCRYSSYPCSELTHAVLLLYSKSDLEFRNSLRGGIHGRGENFTTDLEMQQ